MRFVVGECVGPRVAKQLAEWGHDVFSVYHQARGIADLQVLVMADETHRVLLTCGKRFAERIYRHRLPHSGLILLRLANERTQNKIDVLRRLPDKYADRLEGRFTVATEKTVRIAESHQT
jgi:predicted nuclease of predicted toxin-antitoxin system